MHYDHLLTGQSEGSHYKWLFRDFARFNNIQLTAYQVMKFDSPVSWHLASNDNMDSEATFQVQGILCSFELSPVQRWEHCNVPLLRAYSVGHFRSEPRTKTAHASDQIPMPQTNTPRTNAPCLGAIARNSRGPLRPKMHVIVPLCLGTLSLVCHCLHCPILFLL